MRSSKSIVAGLAAGALAIGGIVGIVAPAASAAVTSVTPEMPDAVRAGSGTTIDATVTSTVTSDVICTAAISAPAGSTFTPVGAALNGTADETVAITVADDSVVAPGSYSLGFYASDDTTGCTALTTQTILATSTLVVGGAVANVAIAPASQQAALGSPVTYVVSATDSAGRPTLFGAANTATGFTFPADTYSLSSNSTTATFNGGSATTVVGSSAATFTAQNSAATTTTMTLTPSNNAIATASAQLSTVTAGTPTGNPAIVDPEPVSNGVPVGTTSVTFAIAGAASEIGKPFVYSVTGTGATNIANQLSADSTASSSGGAVALVAVPVTSSTVGKTVIVTTSTGSVTATMTQRSLQTSTITPSTVVAKTGGTVTISGVVLDQFGAPVPSASVTGSVTAGPNSGTATTNAITTADGSYSLTYTSLPTSTSNDTVTLRVTQGVYANSPLTSKTVTVVFTSTGIVDMSTLTLGSTAVTPAAFASTVVVPFGGTSDDTVTGAAGSVGNTVEITGTAATAGVPVTYTTTDGFLSTTLGTAWDEGKKSVTATSGTAVYFFSTKTGSVSVAASAGGDSLSANLTVVSPPDAARNIALAATPAITAKDTASSVTLSVTDVFGNPSSLGTAVAGGNNSSVTLETNLGTLAGGVSIFTVSATNTEGKATVSLTSSAVGKATVTGLGSGGQFALTAGNPAGSAAPVKSAAVEVEFTDSASKSITIAGARTTVKGKPGIEIDGVTTGIENGKTVIPYFRFPGQTEYTQGSARPEVQDDAFSWTRKTGKKFYAYVTNDDGAVKSNRVIIQAK